MAFAKKSDASRVGPASSQLPESKRSDAADKTSGFRVEFGSNRIFSARILSIDAGGWPQTLSRFGADVRSR